MPKFEVRPSWSPHEAQREVLTSDARFRIVACGRRWGKTEMTAHEAVRYLGEPDTLAWWVAPTYDEASRGFDAVKRAMPPVMQLDEPTETWPKAIDCVNGSRIEFRSTERQNSNRGEGLDLLVLDEADGIRDKAVTEDLRPSLSDTLGDLIAISTPMRRGWFHRWHQRGGSEEYPNFESWQYPTSVNPHIPDEEIEAARRELPERAFAQEYEAQFLDESGGVFRDLDERLFTESYDLPLERVDLTEPVTHGWDLARHDDWTVGTALDAEGRLVYYDRMRDVSWPQIQRAIVDRSEHYGGPVAVDATRDNKLVADLDDEGVPVEPVKFTTQRKREMVENLLAAFENEELSAPDVQQLRHELEVFKYEVTRTGNVRYHAPEGLKDDSVDSLALALEAERIDVTSGMADIGW